MAQQEKRSKGRRKGSGKSHLGLYSVLAIVALLGAYIGVLAYSKPHVDGVSLRADTFVRYVGEKRIKDALVLDQDSIVTGHFVRSDKSIGRYNAKALTGTTGSLLQLLVRNQVPTTIDQQFSKKLVFAATLLIPALIMIVVFVYLLLSYRRGTGLFGIKSGARKWDDDDEQRVTFADVAGQETAIAELRELVGFLTEPERFADLGALIPRGILLYGPPGCGKTLIARALAGEAGASFFSISGSDFVEMYVGVGASRVRELFKEARENAPAIIFIDELDSVGQRRSGGSSPAASSGEHEQTLNQILAEMDGFSPLEGIVLIGATNRPDVLDPALLRPGRFDRAVGLERPGEADRLKILELHAGSRRLAPGVDLAALAHRANGLTGADLANVVNESALLAAQHRKPAISQEELELGLDRIMEAPERQRRLAMRDRSVGRRSSGVNQRVTLDDVAGQDAAKADLRELVDFLSEPKRYTDIGARLPKGVLLFGPPGCGKTLLAKAVAGEANATFITVAATEFVEVFVGEGAARVRDLFAEARMSAPAIVFIDEVDALGARRSQRALNGNQEAEQTLNQLLVELDGFDPSSGVLLMGATNRPDMLDPALLRPGRFDRTIGLERPSEADRLAILRLHAKDLRMAAGADLASLAGRAHGLTGADLAGVLNEAALLAARAGRAELTQAELDEGLDRILEAPERQRRLSARDRSVGRRSSGVEERVTFADVAGVGEALLELQEVRDYLAEPERFAVMGARVPRGILLSGPPGCGKTLLAKAVAGEANAAFFSAAATDFVEVFVGEGAARVRDLFAEARAVAPAIVFIDEIDAVGGRRSNSAIGGNQEREQTLNQLLVELDGFEARTGVLLMCATNRPDMLDPALLRPGRIDRSIEIMLPDRSGRREILEVHLRGKPVAENVDLDTVAAICSGFSGAELASVVNEAALLATRSGARTIGNLELEDGVERVSFGASSRRLVMTEEERRITAYHEAGHALVGLTLPGLSIPHKVSIIPRGRTLGYVWQSGEERVIATRSTLVNQMAMGLGGRSAEELIFGEPGSGASEDLLRVSTIARQMVRDLGMSDALGLMSYPDEADSQPGSVVPNYSGKELALIGDEAKRLVEEAHERALEVLRGSRAALDRIADALLERETVSAHELEELVRGAAVSAT